jgi:hypothetical protein
MTVVEEECFVILRGGEEKEEVDVRTPYYLFGKVGGQEKGLDG